MIMIKSSIGILEKYNSLK